MREIEKRIEAWRTEVAKALGGREDLADELEDHLREDIVRYRSQSISPEESFVLAAARVGDARAIAVQFNQSYSKKGRSKMKTLRIVVTTVLGSYLLAMGLQLIVVTYAVIQELAGFTPHTRGAMTAFFPNLLVCALCSTGIWATWRVKRRAECE